MDFLMQIVPNWVQIKVGILKWQQSYVPACHACWM